MKLINLLNDKLLDLLFHDWRLLLTDLFCLSRFLFDESTVLSSELADEFLDLALFLSLVPLVCETSFYGGDKLAADSSLTLNSCCGSCL